MSRLKTKRAASLKKNEKMNLMHEHFIKKTTQSCIRKALHSILHQISDRSMNIKPKKRPEIGFQKMAETV